MANNSISKGGDPISADDRKLPGRRYTILANDFTQASTGEPVPVFWGSVRRSGSYVTPVFKLRGVAVTTTIGK